MNMNVKKAIILLADGFEEMEAVIPADLMRRAGITVDLVAVNGGNPVVNGSRGIALCANYTFEDIDAEADAIIIPGGMPGSMALAANEKVGDLIKKFFQSGKYVCAICAAPAVVLSPLGVLAGKKFTCYPEMEKDIPEFVGNEKLAEELTFGSEHLCEPVVIDGKLITSRGPGTAEKFAFAIINELCGEEIVKKVSAGTLFGN